MIAAQVAAQAADKKRQQGKKETPIWLMVRPPVPRIGEKKRETQQRCACLDASCGLCRR